MDTHHPGHIDDSVNKPLTPLNQQVIPGYRYPFSLLSEQFPEIFYRLHRTENWIDIHSPYPTTPYNPPEHGWSAKDTLSPLPSSPKEILSLVRNHFSEKSSYASTPSNSIFVPGVWRAGKCSKVSLWDNREDAWEEGRRVGGVEIFEVEREVLREGGSVVFCLEELLGRSSALCWVTRGRYGRVGSGKGRKRGRGWKWGWGWGWEKGGRREGEGLRGKAYLVVGVIPGTRNLPQPTPIIPTPNTTNTNHAFHMQNETEDIIKEDISRTSSAFISTLHGRESSATFGEFEFYFGLEQLREQIQETPLSHTPNPPPRTKKTKPHERKNNPGVFNWTLQNPDVNSIQEYEIERDIRRQAQGRKRDSVLRRMEKILEDGGDRGVVYRGVSRDEDGEEEEELWDMDGGDSREWSWGEDAREKCSNPKRRIKSSARITRKGTFGEGFREKSAVLQDEERTSLRGHSFSSRDFDRSDRDGDGRGRVERSRCVDMGTSTCGLTSGEECGAEEGDTAAGGVGTSVRVRGKHLRKEENDFEYENCKEREREQVCSGSRMSSFISTVIDEEDIEEEEDLQDKDEDIDFDIGPPKRERLPDPRTDTRSATNSRIPIEYLKSRRPVSRKMTARNATSDYFEIDEDTRRRKN